MQAPQVSAPVATPAPGGYGATARPAPYAAPPPSGFAPQASPLLQPGYGAPVYVTPRAQTYSPPPAQLYAPPPAQLYAPSYAPQPSYAQPTYAQPAPSYPPVSMPPLPPGYVYLPTPLGAAPQAYAPGPLQPGEAARREELYQRLHQLDARLDELQRSRVGVGGPITLLVLGYGTTLVAGAVALGSFASAHDIKHGHYRHDRDLDFNDDGDVDHGDYRNWVKAGRVASGIAGAGFLLGVGSTVRLLKNLGLRRAQASELRQLREQQRGVRAQLDYGASYSSGQLNFSVTGRY